MNKIIPCRDCGGKPWACCSYDGREHWIECPECEQSTLGKVTNYRCSEEAAWRDWNAVNKIKKKQ